MNIGIAGKGLEQHTRSVAIGGVVGGHLLAVAVEDTVEGCHVIIRERLDFLAFEGDVGSQLDMIAGHRLATGGDVVGQSIPVVGSTDEIGI